MKKLISLLIVCLVLFSSVSALAVDIDFDSMTVEELQAVIAAAEAKLAELQPEAAEPGVLYEDENIKISLNGDPYIDFSILSIPVIVENYTDRNLLIGIDNTSINGWDVMAGALSVNAQKKAKSDILFVNALEAAEIAKPEDVKEFSYSISYFDEDDFYFSVNSTETYTCTFQ